MFSKKIIASIVAGVTLLASAGVAMAYPSETLRPATVHSGPGPRYSVVGTIPAGESVNVTACQTGWCFVQSPGPSGWVGAGALERRLYRRWYGDGFWYSHHHHYYRYPMHRPYPYAPHGRPFGGHPFTGHPFGGHPFGGHPFVGDPAGAHPGGGFGGHPGGGFGGHPGGGFGGGFGGGHGGGGFGGGHGGGGFGGG
ncbi:MAG: hypothetical protein JWQ89_509, partial [Devosia sp.]|uniref:SH3 domain-containing protein n=1 Tax=Devosia sp. TaxID=1871048 RepID=UPI0026117870